MWESRWIDTVITENEIPSVQVVKVDLASSSAWEQLAAHAALPSVRGVRDILNWHPDPVLSHRDRADLITDPHWLTGFAALREFGFAFDLQVFPDQLRQAAELAARHDDTPIVLDHCGMPIDRDPHALDQWKQELAVVAAQPNTVVKISALGTNDHPWTRRVDPSHRPRHDRRVRALALHVRRQLPRRRPLLHLRRTAVFHPVEGRTAELIDALRACIPAVHDEHGCRLYAIHDAENGTINMIEKWDSHEALAAHAAGPAVRALRAAVAPLVAKPTTVTTMTPLPAGTFDQG